MSWQEPKTDWEASDVVSKDDFNRIEGNIKELNETLIPVGAIMMWSGLISAIPNGWVLCDGNNGTPNLKDRFIMGATTDATINKTGGENQVILTKEQMPAHNHTGSTGSAGTHSHSVGISLKWDAVGDHASSFANTGSISTSSAGSHSHTVTVNNTGGGQPHENRPAYYTLAFIMKV